MKFAKATKLSRKSGGMWGTRRVPTGFCQGPDSGPWSLSWSDDYLILSKLLEFLLPTSAQGLVKLHQALVLGAACLGER